jgi:hypothetical protein
VTILTGKMIDAAMDAWGEKQRIEAEDGCRQVVAEVVVMLGQVVDECEHEVMYRHTCGRVKCVYCGAFMTRGGRAKRRAL